MHATRSGLDVLLTDAAPCLHDARIGVLANQASINRAYAFAWDALAAAYPGQLRALYSPQHGLWAEQQANMVESGHGRHSRLGVPVFSLYSETRRPSDKMLAAIDVLIVDLQDVGTRVYTFLWTLRNCLIACAEAGVEVIVLDRPNPLGGVGTEGAVLHSDFRSFVGDACIPMRHGLTLAEMARYLNSSQQLGADLTSVPMQNWRRGATFAETGLPWVPPSPNMPTPQSMLVYPGQVLLEGTNLSEGRGTTTPFELVGAPFIDPDVLGGRLADRSLPGVIFRPVRFRPTFDKWATEVCGGVAIHVTDTDSYQPYRTTLELLSTIRALYPDEFFWADPPYEYEHERMPIDILSGDSRLRTLLDEQGSLTPEQFDVLCTDGVADWSEQSRACWLYERESATD